MIIAVLSTGSCDNADDVSYRMVSVLKDERSGKLVELGEVHTISSYGFNLYVFDEIDENRKFDSSWKPIISTSDVGENKPSLSFNGKCYIVYLNYGHGGLLASRYEDKVSNAELCFDLSPDRGPKRMKIAE